MARNRELPQIIISGSIANDHVKVYSGSLLDHYSELPPHFSVSLLIDSMEMHRGGTGANIAYTLALLGEQPVLFGAVGREDREYILRLQKLGVDTSHIHFSNKYHTARFEGVTDKENNQSATFYVGAMKDCESLTFAILKGKNAVVVVSPHDPKMMHQQVKEAREFGLKLCFDVGQQVSEDNNEELLSDGLETAEILFLNGHEKEMFAHKLGLRVEDLDTRVPICVTTYGAEGSILTGTSIKEPIQIPVAKISKVVDPTGAGDAYRAGFLFGFVRAWDLKICAQIGATAAAYAVENSGGQEHFFTKEEFLERYRHNFNDELSLD